MPELSALPEPTGREPGPAPPAIAPPPAASWRQLGLQGPSGLTPAAPTWPLPARARLAAMVGAGLAAASRATGRGSGSVVGGHAILAIEPRALARFSAGRQVVLVSGTNGKTTTTKLLARALAAGFPGGATGEVVSNFQGANLRTGLAAALAAGQPGAPAVLEVDEAWLEAVAAEVRPAALVLLNLSRDQLDRNNEVRHVARRWRRACEALSRDAMVVANADDPLVAWAAAPAPRVVWVGAGLGWKNDSVGCPNCGGPIVFGAPAPAFGAPAPAQVTPAAAEVTPAPEAPETTRPWRCLGCGLARPAPQIWLEPSADGGTAVLASGDRYELKLQLPGRCNQANAVTALAAVLELGSPADGALVAMGGVRDVAGRYATVPSGGAEARLLLAKNPAGWAEVFDMLYPAPAPVVVAINARTADGHDPSWLWDVPFECLRPRLVVATGERYLDLAVRLHYAGVEHAAEADLVAALHRAAAAAPAADATDALATSAAGGQSNGRRLAVDVVANYTAFHQYLARLGNGAAR